MQKKTDF